MYVGTLRWRTPNYFYPVSQRILLFAGLVVINQLLSLSNNQCQRSGVHQCCWNCWKISYSFTILYYMSTYVGQVSQFVCLLYRRQGPYPSGLVVEVKLRSLQQIVLSPSQSCEWEKWRSANFFFIFPTKVTHALSLSLSPFSSHFYGSKKKDGSRWWYNTTSIF